MPDARSPRDLQIVDTVLTNVARQYRPEGFIFDQVAPRIGVETDSGRYPTFTLESFFGDDSDSGDQTKVSDRAETPEISFEWSTDTYYCEDYRLKVSITAKERRQGHAALRLETSKLSALLDRMALRREIRIANALRQTGDSGQLTGGSATPSNNWDVDAATIETDIKTGALAVRGKIGRMTNALVMDLEVAYAVALQQDIRDIIKYTVPGDRILIAGDQILPSQLHRHRVIVPEAMRNTAKKGATTTLSKIWSDEARLLYLPPDGGGWGIPSVAYSFNALGEEVDRWQEKDPPVDYIRAWEDVDEKICAPDAGYSLKALLS
jgi:hypothetical protein